MAVRFIAFLNSSLDVLLMGSLMVKKLVPVAPEQELIAHCSAPFEDKAGPGGLLPGEIPGILANAESGQVESASKQVQ